MQKEISQIRGFSRALSVICTIALVLMFIGALGLIVGLFMSGNAQFIAMLEESGYGAVLGNVMHILPLYFVYALVTVAVYITVFFMLRKVLRNINDLEIFNGENAKKIDTAAYILIISAIVLPLVLTIGNLISSGTFAYSLSFADIFIGLALLLFSRILLYGRAQQNTLSQAQVEIQRRYNEKTSTDEVYKDI